MRVLVLGVTGMLGQAMFRLLGAAPGFAVFGTARCPASATPLPTSLVARVVWNVEALEPAILERAVSDLRPDVVVNCIGLVKQRSAAEDPLLALPLNAMLPHRLARLCDEIGARLIHFSTDCVFSGRGGGYRETDPPDPVDLYGRSKLLGELDAPHAVTLRTSIIGPELRHRTGLLEWFLAQQGPVAGFKRVVFSGLPTVELASVVRDLVLPRETLCGLFHVAADPIDKCSLLRLIAARYEKRITIEPRDEPVIDRSLDASAFRAATGYTAPSWGELVHRMHVFG